MMKYGVRVALGALVGLVLAVGLTLWLDRWWIGALGGGLLGPVVFLGTFFVWSADRPEEGYEQVLFDRPNTVLSGVMMLAFAGLAFGAGFLGGPAVDPAEQAALAEMEAQRVTLSSLSRNYTLANDALQKGEDPGDLAAKEAAAREARVALQTMEVPGALKERKATLQKAASALETAYANLAKCKAGEEPACLDARVGHADAARALQTYGEKA